jgi:serine/threonine protein phosphatase 1
MTHRRIIIGDIHGHYDTLMSLLDAIALRKDDQIYFLGDLIDRGPDSAKVVDFVFQNQYKCLLGNHEQMLLDAVGNGQIATNLLQAWLYSGGHSTLISYNNNIPQEHIDWMKTLPTYLDLGDIWLVHAGIHPSIPLEKQTAEQFCWIRDEFHSINKPYFTDKLIITGHTITFTFPGVQPGQLVAGAGWLDIDTGAYHQNSGWLTGLDVTNGKVYQVHAKKGTRRTLPLEKAVTTIEPSLVLSKRAKRASEKL